jgi:predicted O-methyltransferase YrrM
MFMREELITLHETITIPDLYSQLNIERRPVSLTKAEAEFIYVLLKQTGIKKTLEIGLAYGCSAAYIIAASESQHHAIDKEQSKIWKNLGIENLEMLNLDHHLKLQEDWSHNALPKLLSQGLNFDFVFIDGDHKFDGIMNDFYYVDLLLNENGYVLFDDLWMKATQIVVNWMETNRLDYKRIDLTRDEHGNFALFQKIGGYERDWDHFNEFRHEKCPYKEI